MPTIKSENDLNKLLDTCAKEYLRVFQKKVHDIIKVYIDRYYEEYDPIKYERTEQFLNSLVSTEITKTGNTYQCTVYIDTDNMHYNVHNGLEVVNMINSGFHANTLMFKKGLYETPYDIETDVGRNFWENSMIESQEELAKTLIQCFKSHGILVKEV